MLAQRSLPAPIIQTEQNRLFNLHTMQQADEKVVSVLLLFNFDKQTDWHHQYFRAIEDIIAQHGYIPNVLIENSNGIGMNRPGFADAYAKSLEMKYQGASLDFVIAQNILSIQLFEQYPELFAGARKYLVTFTDNPNLENTYVTTPFFTKAYSYHDLKTAIPLYEELTRPNKIWVISSSDMLLGLDRNKGFKETLATIDTPAQWLMNKTYKELLQILNNADPDDIVLYLGTFNNGMGRFIQPFEMIYALAPQLDIPMFSMWRFVSDQNTPLAYSFDIYKFASNIARQMLWDAKLTQSAPLLEKHYTYVVNEASPFLSDIDLSGFPSEAVIVNPQPSFWHAHVEIMLLFFVLLSGAVIVIFLQLYYSRKLRTKSAAAEAANIAKSQFLANMSHEIRTPMNGIIGILDIMKQRELGESEKEYLTLIERSSLSLLNLLNDILDLSMVEKGVLQIVPKSFDVSVLLEEIIDGFAVNIKEKQIILKVQNITPDVWIYSDQFRTKQIFMNIISNAVKYTRQGIVEISLVEREEHIVLTVEDTGIGISKEQMEKLFVPFERDNVVNQANIEGAGLGLSIALEIAKLLGGEISAESMQGVGSTFTVTLPKAIDIEDQQGSKQASQSNTEQVIAPVMLDEAVELTDFGQRPSASPLAALDSSECVPVSTEVSPGESSVKSRQLTILVAEDNEINQIVIQEQLSLGQHKVLVVNDGYEALEAYQQFSFDVIIMDVMMPNMDGLTATKKIRLLETQNKQHIPIIGLTANAIKGDKEECLNAGMDCYLAKPTHSEVLLDALQNVTRPAN